MGRTIIRTRHTCRMRYGVKEARPIKREPPAFEQNLKCFVQFGTKEEKLFGERSGTISEAVLLYTVPLAKAVVREERTGAHFIVPHRMFFIRGDEVQQYREPPLPPKLPNEFGFRHALGSKVDFTFLPNI
jgi:hypothetical protein